MERRENKNITEGCTTDIKWRTHGWKLTEESLQVGESARATRKEGAYEVEGSDKALT